MGPRRGIAALSTLVVLCCVPASASGDTFNVNTTADPPIGFPGPSGCAGGAMDCSLRQAIQDANSTVGLNTVNVPPGTYTLTLPPVLAQGDDNRSGDLNITNTTGATSIIGMDPTTTIVQAGTSLATSLDRVFRVGAGANASISGLTIQFGQARGFPAPPSLGNSGGGILDLGTLALTNDVVTQNSTLSGAGGGGLRFAGSPPSTLTVDGSMITMNNAGDGGGIVEDNASGAGGVPPSGTVTITRSTIANNSAGFGGGVSEEDGGAINIAQSTIHGNTSASGGGGVVQNGGGPVSIVQSTIDANTAQYGGGIDEEAGNPPAPSTAPAVTLINDTLSGNRAVGPGGTNVGGGGIDLNGGGTFVIINSTISGNSTTGASAGNTQGGNIHDDGADPVNLTNTILSGGMPANCQTTATNQFFSSGSHGRGTANGHNLSDDSTCALAGASGDLFPVNPLLGPLGNNGGPTQTQALLAGSPAVDAANDAACPPTDQRGVTRPFGAHCDIGAFEATTGPPPAPPATGPAATTPAPLRPQSAGPSASELALGCSSQKLVLTNVVILNHKVSLAGAADKTLIGRRVEILFAARRVVATATVGPGGLFATTAPLPAQAVRSSNRARYVARVGRDRSLALKLTRRVAMKPPESRSGIVTLSGVVVPPLTRPLAAIDLQVRVSCTQFKSVAHLSGTRNGRFQFRVKAPTGQQAVVYRVSTAVRKSRTSRKRFPTFSLPLPVQVS